MPMAQCQRDGKKQSGVGSFDLYPGLFTTKLHNSVRYNKEVSNLEVGKQEEGGGGFNSARGAPYGLPAAAVDKDPNCKGLLNNANMPPHSGNACHRMSVSEKSYRGFYKDTGQQQQNGNADANAAAAALALWGRPEVEVPKDDNSCFVGGFSSGELTSAASSTGGSPTVARSANTASSSSASTSSRGSSAEGSPTSSRALPTSRSLNEGATSAAGFAFLARSSSTSADDPPSTLDIEAPAPRKSTSDLPTPSSLSRHARQPSLGLGFYVAGTATSKTPPPASSDRPLTSRSTSDAATTTTTLSAPAPISPTPAFSKQQPIVGLSNSFCVGGSFPVSSSKPGSKVSSTSKSPSNATGMVTGGSFAPSAAANKHPQQVMITKGLGNMDPEELKNLGNDMYKRGQFVEALSFYDKAILLCPDRAPYRSNRAAALTGLGRLTEAEQECQQVIKLDPSFTRAHQRLGSIYLRLGRVEDSKKHFKRGGHHTDRSDLLKIENIDKHLTKCLEAKRALDWTTVIQQADAAVAAGADSAPQILALKAEALLKLRKLEEADAVLKDAQKLEASLGRPMYDSHILVVQAQIDMSLGRFEDAIKAAEDAARFDPYNLELLALLKRARAVGSARSRGNDLYKAGRYAEACVAYGGGLEIEPIAVLFCNRAACRHQLGQWEKAIDDCNAALEAQPQYIKALLRRANCYAKLERWEDSRRDFEVLRRKCPTDDTVARQLLEVQAAISKSSLSDFNSKMASPVLEVLNSDHFQEAINCPGLAVVHFNKRRNERCRQLSTTLDQLCKIYPAITFAEVDVDDQRPIATAQSIGFVPTLKIFSNGRQVQEILGPSQAVLEQAVKNYNSLSVGVI